MNYYMSHFNERTVAKNYGNLAHCVAYLIS